MISQFIVRNLALSTVVMLFTLTTPVAETNGTYTISPDSIYEHIAILAHDSLEGREVGEIGEWKAARYLIDIFEHAKLEPRGDSMSFLQPFEFTKAIEPGPKNTLTINDIKLQLGEEFQPLRQSASSVFSFREAVFVNYGIVVDENDGDYNDYADKDVVGKAVIMKRFAPSPPETLPEDSSGTDFSRYSFLTSKINTAIEHKAGAVFFITPEDMEDALTTLGPAQINTREIPIIFLRHKALEKLGLNLSNPDIMSIEGKTQLIKTRDTGYNVVGYLPAENDTTIIIGAHFDHLGWGTEASHYRGEEKMIHNGADDNASGTAVLLELARYFNSISDDLHYSLLFIAFSGEEAGILGSTHFANNMTVDPDKVRMMINIDMVGRLRDQKGLVVFGTGTAAEFKNYFDSLKSDKLRIISKESGISSSDHTPFFNREIPTLFFFTGAHEDYHKPSDDIEKIDFEGTTAVTSLVTEVVTYFDRYEGSLSFQKTKSKDHGHKRPARLSVTLGITPDFITEVNGLRVDGVSPERPADQAGIQIGDIIISIDKKTVGDIYDYMGALGRFRSGDSTYVTVQRENDTLRLKVLFEK